jgi:hypothetical protein
MELTPDEHFATLDTSVPDEVARALAKRFAPRISQESGSNGYAMQVWA